MINDPAGQPEMGMEGFPPSLAHGEAPDKKEMLARLNAQAGIAGVVPYDLDKAAAGIHATEAEIAGVMIADGAEHWPEQNHDLSKGSQKMADQIDAEILAKHNGEADISNDVEFSNSEYDRAQKECGPGGRDDNERAMTESEVRAAGGLNLNTNLDEGTQLLDMNKGTVQRGADGRPEYTERPPEQEIYTRMWNDPAYRNVAPGEEVAQIFLAEARPREGARIIDMGCGTGRGALMLAVLGKLNVTMLDFTTNSLDEDIVPMLTTQSHVMRFQQHDLTKPLPVSAEYGFCTDVMEHIPPQDVDRVLNNALTACQHVFFQIATEPDVMGARIGLPLHLSVHDYAWWLNKFNERECTIHWSQDRGGSCMFYVTAWTTGKEVVDYGRLNTTDEQVKANVLANIWYGCEGKDANGDAVVSMQTWKQVTPHQSNEYDAIIVGGGPSLTEHVEEIRQRRKDGARLIALNGAFNWCLAHQIVPSAVVVVDAREFNARFTHPEPELLAWLDSDPVAKGQYEKIRWLIASQCHPSVLQGLPHENTFLWHTSTEMIQAELKDRYSAWYGVRGGTTVLLRSIPLLRLLGFHRFGLYGCDSCVAVYKPDDGPTKQLHHAYEQLENADEPLITVTVQNNGVPGASQFLCHGWMIAQAQGFIDTIRAFGHDIEIEVCTGGLLAYILEHGAAEFDRQVFM